MGATRALSEISPRGLLGTVCAKNQPIEIGYRDRKDNDCLVTSRFIALEPRRVLVDLPSVGGHSVSIPAGTIVSVYFGVDAKRWVFQSKVIGQRLFQLNEHKKIIVVQLWVPTEIFPHQRRKDFRISLASYDGLDVFFVPIDQKLPKDLRLMGFLADGSEAGMDEEKAPVGPGEATATSDAEGDGGEDVGEAETSGNEKEKDHAAEVSITQLRMANLSAGGLAAVLSDTDPLAASVQAGDRFWAVFALPGDEEIFRFPLEIRHVKRPKEIGNPVLGCKFLLDDNTFDVRASVRRIARFVAYEQRCQLRRGRM